MTLALAQLNEHAPDKPRRGQPCNGCGYCCAAEVCDIGKDIFGEEQAAPCPAMQFEAGRFWCGAVREADKMENPIAAFALKFMLGIGFGCDADDVEVQP